MEDADFYTHGEWLVQPGCEAEFIAAWKGLGETFAALDKPPLWGTLLQSQDNPRLFFSFGPWKSQADVAAMRSNAHAQTVLETVRDLCERSSPSGCRRVAHVDVGG